MHHITTGNFRLRRARQHDGRSTRRRWSSTALVVTAAVLGLVACGGNDAVSRPKRDAGGNEPAMAATAADSAAVDDAGMADEGLAVGEASDEGGSPGAAPAPAEGNPAGSTAGLPVGRDIIVTVDVDIESADLKKSVRTVLDSATKSGGYLATSDINYSEETPDESSEPSDTGTESGTDQPPTIETGRAVLVIRLPTRSTQGFVDSLGKAGTVTASKQTTDDVTSQLVDLDVRIANARDSVETVRALLAKTTAIKDLVSLEAELNSRVTNLELLEAQKRGLRDQVSLSTVTVTITPPPPPIVPVAEPETINDKSIGSLLREGWDAFAATVGAIVRVIAVSLPFLLTALVLIIAVRWWAQRKRAQKGSGAGGAGAGGPYAFGAPPYPHASHNAPTSSADPQPTATAETSSPTEATSSEPEPASAKQSTSE